MGDGIGQRQRAGATVRCVASAARGRVSSESANAATGYGKLSIRGPARSPCPVACDSVTRSTDAVLAPFYREGRRNPRIPGSCNNSRADPGVWPISEPLSTGDRSLSGPWRNASGAALFWAPPAAFCLPTHTKQARRSRMRIDAAAVEAKLTAFEPSAARAIAEPDRHRCS